VPPIAELVFFAPTHFLALTVAPIKRLEPYHRFFDHP
jgi:hypothetical protein